MVYQIKVTKSKTLIEDLSKTTSQSCETRYEAPMDECRECGFAWFILACYTSSRGYKIVPNALQANLTTGLVPRYHFLDSSI